MLSVKLNQDQGGGDQYFKEGSRQDLDGDLGVDWQEQQSNGAGKCCLQWDLGLWVTKALNVK